MSDIIHVLPDNIANQIAAGEVVQRPSSVVKELMENAVDSGGDTITVKVKDAGKTLIQVVDNGCGMSETDARIAFERHSTSKIKNANDLFAIQTMGFRGEALASIAAVSQVQLKTKRKEDELGTRIDIEGSGFKKQEPLSCPDGSIFMVKNLFYNVPARRKFLKKDSTELKHIINEFQKVALANNTIDFSLFHNNIEIYNLPKSNLKSRIVNLFGKNANHYLIGLESETSIIQMKGFIGKPENAKKKFGEQYFFVNNRYIRHPYFHKAVMSAYEQILPHDSIPSYFIYMKVNPDIIDINIHPTKTEIKFQDEQAIWQILRATVKETLAKHNIVPSLDFNNEANIEIPVFRKNAQVNPPSVKFDPAFNPFESQDKKTHSTNQSFKHDQSAKGWEELFENESSPASFVPEATSVDSEPSQETISDENTGCQTTNRFFHFKGKYILTQVKSGLMIIDQKKAHERILFEKFLKTLENKQGLAQQSLYPETIELNPADYTIISDIMDDLMTIGFDIRDFGSNTVILNGVPSELRVKNGKELIESLIEEYKQTESNVKEGIHNKIALSMAKVAAIGYGIILAEQEMRELVDTLFACQMPNYSPGGGTIITILTLEELEKRFKT